ncbi:MAG: hypothetical protein J6I70_01890, partial [Bacteroidaceae bacterium]|nr:hypothetical protein [Bacteroidaceae bacterium]
LFPETPKHFKRKIEEILNLILKTLIYNYVLKHIFLYHIQEDKYTYIPYYNSKRKIRDGSINTSVKAFKKTSSRLRQNALAFE